MLDALWWLLVAEVIGLSAFPLAYYLLPQLKDRGYSVSKPLGILLIGFVSWILSVLHVVPSVQPTLWLILLVMAGLSGWYVWLRRREFREFVVREWRALIAIEAVFLVLFVGWAIFRSYDPAIDHTEQPMDFAFFNAAITSDVGQPQDPWLSGEHVSYYYFGYWMMGAVSELSGITSNISYNLAMALIPALVAAGIFGLVYNMVRTDVPRWVYGVVGGLGAVVLVGVVGNLEGVLEFMRHNGMGSQGFYDWVRIQDLDGPLPGPAVGWAPQEADPGQFWWWFRATRVINTFEGGQGIDYTIQEFPFFSFMLGDMHPHVMAIPFAVLFMALCWNWLRSPTNRWLIPVTGADGSASSGSANFQGYAFLLAMALGLGGLAFTNMWDGPTFAALFLAAAVVMTYRARGGGAWTLISGVGPVAAVVLGLAFLLYLPYYLSFASSITGIAPVAAATTRPVHTFLLWGLFFVAVAPFVVATFWQTTVRGDWRRVTLFGLLVWVAPFLLWAFLHLLEDGNTGDLRGRFFRILPFGLLISMAVYNVFWLAKEKASGGRLFAMLLTALALLLIMGPELLFIGDSFNTRMNTVFKLYYQAWILLAVVAGYAIYYWSFTREAVSGWRRALTTLWAGAVIVLLAGSLYYPPAAATTKGDLQDGSATLDGLAFLARIRPAEYEAIKFVRNHVDKDAAMVEAVGEWFDAGLISRSTGVPTVFNWPGHELQWRGSTEKFDGREQDVARIYETQDVEEATNLLAKYDVEYVYVGPRERFKYGSDGLAKFPTFMRTVFSEGDVAIYRVRK